MTKLRNALALTPGSAQIAALLAIAILTNVAVTWMNNGLGRRFEVEQYFAPFELMPLMLLGFALSACVAAFIGPLSTVAVCIGLMIVAAATQDRAPHGVALLLVSVASAAIVPAIAAALVRVAGTLTRTAVLMVALHGVFNLSLVLTSVGLGPSPENFLFPVLAACALAIGLFVTLGSPREAAAIAAAPAPAPFHWPVLVALPLLAGAAGLQSALFDVGLGMEFQRLGNVAAIRLFDLNSVIIVLGAGPLIALLRRAPWRNGYLPLGLLAAGGLALSAASVVPLLELAGRATTAPFLLFITVGELLALPLLLARFAVGHSWRVVTGMVAAFHAVELAFRQVPEFVGGRLADPVLLGIIAGLLIAAGVALVAVDTYASRWLWPEAAAPRPEDALVGPPEGAGAPAPPPTARS